jgi:hypothetical protein
VTLGDVERSALYDAANAGSTSAVVHDAGLRGGTFSGQFTGALHLRRVVYVPGVTVSGTLDEARGIAHLQIAGRSAVHRKLTLVKRHPPALRQLRVALSSRAFRGSGRPSLRGTFGDGLALAPTASGQFAGSVGAK